MFIVGGDKILLIEKLRLEPFAAVLFSEFVKKICWATVEHESVESKKLFDDILVHAWVAVVIIGANDELAESNQTEGKPTKIDPFFFT